MDNKTNIRRIRVNSICVLASTVLVSGLTVAADGQVGGGLGAGNRMENRQPIRVSVGGAGGDGFAAAKDLPNLTTSASSPSTTGAVINVSKTRDAAPAFIYGSARYGPELYFTFSKLAPSTKYQVRLHFVEDYFEKATARVFDVAINGKPVLRKFDIFADSGGKNIADVKTFIATANSKGEIRIAATSTDEGEVDNAIMSAIEILPALANVGADSTAGPEIGGEDEGCCGTGAAMQLVGNPQFFQNDVPIVGADNPRLFREEAFGPEFSVAVPNLPAGQYTIEIQFTETYVKAAGERLMDISVGDKKVAENYDIFARAGGMGKVITLSSVVSHPGDALLGPLTINFKGVVEKAKFNAIRIKDAAGHVVASSYASQLHLAQAEIKTAIPVVNTPSIAYDPTKPRVERVADLVARMSLSEKVAQLQNQAPAIDRLKLPRYGYWNEALHGIARNGFATVFPQAIGMAATWDVNTVGSVADVISTEGRAKYAAAQARGSHGQYQGLNFWSPNINIFRDPRWGRGQETYGEDPWLTSRMAVAFIEGMQGDDPNFLKTMACAKHFAVHSGPEKGRASFDSVVSPQDLHDTYFPAFEAAVREARVGAVMSAYNAINGVPSVANKMLLQNTLRETWGFQGHVVSDCGAISNAWNAHKFMATPQQAAALSVKAGTDLECGSDYKNLVSAVSQGLITEAEIDVALKRVLDARFRLGMFDPPALVKWTKIAATDNDSPDHAQVALQAARKSIVLLKNDGLLPLDPAKMTKVAVIGPDADALPALLGNYNGTPSNPVTILQGIRYKAGATNVTYARGVPLALGASQSTDTNGAEFLAAISAAKSADVVIYVGGLSPNLEGEEMNVSYAGFDGGDRTSIEIPPVQHVMLQALQATGKPLVYVNCSGSAVAMPWEASNIPAIVQAWYSGQAGGTAVADVLWGEYNPAGRLPITFYNATSDLPAFTNYDMNGRTYRYFAGKPLWAFGHGLSYTQFNYGTPSKVGRRLPTGSVTLEIPVQNVGKMAGEEVVQVYVRPLFEGLHQPRQRLVAFQRVAIGAGQVLPVKFEILLEALRIWDQAKESYVVAPGAYELGIGAASDDIRVTSKLQVGD